MRERGVLAQEGLSTSSWDVGSTGAFQQAVQREKDHSGMMMEQQRGNIHHRIKLKSMES